MKTIFKLVQLSDLHLTAKDPLARSEPKLFGKLKGMNENFRRLLASPAVQSADRILVTGDVTDRGDFATWVVFRHALADARLHGKTMALPGNHDVCSLGAPRWGRNGQTRKEDLDKARRGLQFCRMKVRFPWVEKPHEDVAIFGLDSNNAGNLTAVSNAVGHLGFFQLEKLARLLHKHRNVPVKILALHHSPNIPSPETARKRFHKELKHWEALAHQVPEWERRTLRLLALTHGVDLVMHGHLHYAEDRRVNGVRIVGAPASTEPAASSNGGRSLQFLEYSVSLASHRIRKRLVEVPIS